MLKLGNGDGGAVEYLSHKHDFLGLFEKNSNKWKYLVFNPNSGITCIIMLYKYIWYCDILLF